MTLMTITIAGLSLALVALMLMVLLLNRENKQLLEKLERLTEKNWLLEATAKDQRAALNYRDMAISELKRQTAHLSTRQTLIEQATFGHSYAERAEGEYSSDVGTETLPAHQRANMGH